MTKPVSIPITRIAGVEYVRREHFDAAVQCALMNQATCRALQKDRDQWQAKASRQEHGRRR
jgi:hypothetical protein